MAGLNQQFFQPSTISTNFKVVTAAILDFNRRMKQLMDWLSNSH